MDMEYCMKEDPTQEYYKNAEDHWRDNHYQEERQRIEAND
jgi:hypothetical protein